MDKSPGPVQVGHGMWIDVAKCVIIRGGVSIALSGQEVNLLEILLLTPNSYVKTDELLQGVLSEDNIVYSADAQHCLESTISNIRGKLGEIPHHPAILRCCRRRGYGIFPQT
jgi:DNA-binding response OmpR family regulator